MGGGGSNLEKPSVGGYGCFLEPHNVASLFPRPFAEDGVEIGSLLVPMVLTSQMAFIERWDDKNLRVTGTVFISHD